MGNEKGEIRSGKREMRNEKREMRSGKRERETNCLKSDGFPAVPRLGRGSPE